MFLTPLYTVPDSLVVSRIFHFWKLKPMEVLDDSPCHSCSKKYWPDWPGNPWPPWNWWGRREPFNLCRICQICCSMTCTALKINYNWPVHQHLCQSSWHVYPAQWPPHTRPLARQRTKMSFLKHYQQPQLAWKSWCSNNTCFVPHCRLFSSRCMRILANLIIEIS